MDENGKDSYLDSVALEIAEDIHAADIERDIDAMLASFGAEEPNNG